MALWITLDRVGPARADDPARAGAAAGGRRPRGGRPRRTARSPSPGPVDGAAVSSFTRHLASRRDVIRITATGRGCGPRSATRSSSTGSSCPVMIVWGDSDRLVFADRRQSSARGGSGLAVREHRELRALPAGRAPRADGRAARGVRRDPCDAVGSVACQSCDAASSSPLAAGALALAGAGVWLRPGRLVGGAIGAPRAIVVGAGLAGLTAAFELERRGWSVTVLEARDRLGGRVLTVRRPFAGGQYAEAGGEFIDVNQTRIQAYARRFGLPLEDVRRGFAGSRRSRLPPRAALHDRRLHGCRRPARARPLRRGGVRARPRNRSSRSDREPAGEATRPALGRRPA